MATPRKNFKKKKVVVESKGIVKIHTTFNNIIITITNLKGDTITWSSAGKMGFKGSKKNTPFAATQTSVNCAKEAFESGVKTVDVYVKGPGVGRDAAIRSLKEAGLEVLSIHEVTPLPHNGCRPPKRRRV